MEGCFRMSEAVRRSVVITQDGLRKLEQELQELKTTKRQEVAERIKVAISFGDLSENSEYDEAKNEQAFIEGRIMTIENMLRQAEVVDEEDIRTDVVNVGAAVSVLDIEENEELEYTIVGPMEADIASMKISNESPVGRALVGKGKGEEVSVNAPAGTLRLRILDIKKQK